MDEARIEKLCEELHEVVGLGPGQNPQALDRVKAIIRQFQTDSDATSYVREKAIGALDSFERWFSARRWQQDGAHGSALKSHLHTDIAKLESAMRTSSVIRARDDNGKSDG